MKYFVTFLLICVLSVVSAQDFNYGFYTSGGKLTEVTADSFTFNISALKIEKIDNRLTVVNPTSPTQCYFCGTIGFIGRVVGQDYLHYLGTKEGTQETYSIYINPMEQLITIIGKRSIISNDDNIEVTDKKP